MERGSRRGNFRTLRVSGWRLGGQGHPDMSLTKTNILQIVKVTSFGIIMTLVMVIIMII